MRVVLAALGIGLAVVAAWPAKKIDAGTAMQATPAAVPARPIAAVLGSADDHAKVRAVEEAVRSRAVEVVPILAAVDLEQEPVSAPTIVHGVAMLARGSAAEPLAGKTLARWLDQESHRAGRDAIGNVPNIIEALADLGTREAIDTLVDALDEAHLDLPLEALIVRRLAKLGDSRARAAIARFAGRAAAYPVADEFEGRLRDEAIAAARGAD